jgi:hypothetical protein
MADEQKIAELEQLVSKLAHEFMELTTDTGKASATHGRSLQLGGSTTFSSGDTGFMILCAAIVLMMTIPGLGLYYSGKPAEVDSRWMECIFN